MTSGSAWASDRVRRVLSMNRPAHAVAQGVRPATSPAAAPSRAPRGYHRAVPLPVPARALLADAGCVVAFVALGRASHAERLDPVGLAATAAPFLVGLGVAWVVVRAWRRPDAVATGAAVWAVTAVVGLAVRWAVGGGVAPSFVLVTMLVLAALLVGWRAAVAVMTRHPRKAQA